MGLPSRPAEARPVLRVVSSDGLRSVPSLLGEEVEIGDDAVAKATHALREDVGVGAPVHELPLLAATPLPTRRVRWVRNVLLGAGVSFADAGLSALKPLKFVWDNLPVVGQAIIYMALPLIPSFMLLSYVPALAEAFSPRTPIGALYMVGLYISSAFVLMLGAFTAGFCWRGGIRLMDHFAQAGEDAFPER